MKVAATIVLVMLGLLAIGLLFVMASWVEAAFVNTFVPRTVETSADLPWVRPGEKARYFSKRRADWNTGVTSFAEWGSNFWRSEDPITTAYDAFAFLENRRAMDDWPRSHDGDSGTFTHPSVYDELTPDIRTKTDPYGQTIVTYLIRVAPYRFHLVSIEPTVIVMQPKPELLDWWGEYVRSEYSETSRWVRWIREMQSPQLVAHTIWLENPIEFGTRLPAENPGSTAGWLWFSPDLRRPPGALPLSRTAPAELPLDRGRLVFTPVGEGWAVTRE